MYYYYLICKSIFTCYYFFPVAFRLYIILFFYLLLFHIYHMWMWWWQQNIKLVQRSVLSKTFSIWIFPFTYMCICSIRMLKVSVAQSLYAHCHYIFQNWTKQVADSQSFFHNLLYHIFYSDNTILVSNPDVNISLHFILLSRLGLVVFYVCQIITIHNTTFIWDMTCCSRLFPARLFGSSTFRQICYAIQGFELT